VLQPVLGSVWYSVHFQVMPVDLATASITFLPFRNTSGPMPSPGSTQHYSWPRHSPCLVPHT